MKATAQFQPNPKPAAPLRSRLSSGKLLNARLLMLAGFSSRVGSERVLAVKLCVSAKTRALIDPLDCDWKRERKAKINTKPSTASTTNKSGNGATWPAHDKLGSKFKSLAP